MKRHGNVLKIDREGGITLKWHRKVGTIHSVRWERETVRRMAACCRWVSWQRARDRDAAARGEVRSHRCEGKTALSRSQGGWKEQQWQDELSIEWAEAVGTTQPRACCKQSMKCWCIAWRWVLSPSYSSGWPQGAYGLQGLQMQIWKDVIKRGTVILDESPSLDAGVWKHIFSWKLTGTKQLYHHGGVQISHVRWMKADTASPPPTMNPAGSRAAGCHGQMLRIQTPLLQFSFAGAYILGYNWLRCMETWW